MVEGVDTEPWEDGEELAAETRGRNGKRSSVGRPDGVTASTPDGEGSQPSAGGLGGDASPPKRNNLT